MGALGRLSLGGHNGLPRGKTDGAASKAIQIHPRSTDQDKTDRGPAFDACRVAQASLPAWVFDYRSPLTSNTTARFCSCMVLACPGSMNNCCTLLEPSAIFG